MSNNSKDLTLKEATQYFGVSEQTLRRWIKSGKLTAELRDSPYGQQYFIPAYQVQTASEIQDVVKVDRTIDMASLARIMAQYLDDREQSLVGVLESIQTEIRESIQRFEQRENELMQEIAAAREENRELREHIDGRMKERDRKLMETLRSTQEATAHKEQKNPKRKRWPWNR